MYIIIDRVTGKVVLTTWEYLKVEIFFEIEDISNYWIISED